MSSFKPTPVGIVTSGVGIALDYATEALFGSRRATAPDLPVPVPPSVKNNPVPVPVVSTKSTDVVSRVDSAVNMAQAIAEKEETVTTRVISSRSEEASAIQEYRDSRSALNDGLKSSGATNLLDILSKSNDTAVEIKTALDDVASAMNNVVSVNGAVGTMITEKIDSLTGVVAAIVTALYENSSGSAVANINVDTVPIASAISSLTTAINPQSREDFYTTSKAVNDYKLTPVDIKDLDGNTLANMKPMEAHTVKNITEARLRTDMNNFELDEGDFDISLLDGLDISSLFSFEKKSTRLMDLVGEFGSGV